MQSRFNELKNIGSKRYLSKVILSHVKHVLGVSLLIIAGYFCLQSRYLAPLRHSLVTFQTYVANIYNGIVYSNSRPNAAANNLEVQYKLKLIDQLLEDLKQISFLRQRTADYERSRVGQVILATVNKYAANITINIGSQDGVQKDDYVVNESGLIGRITEVSDKWSTAILSTNINSSIPIKFKSDGNMAIAQGDNSGRMRITLKNGIFEVKQNDSVLTSGYGGLYLKDLPVGTIDEQGFIRPCYDYKQLRFVCIIGHLPY